MVDQAVIMVDLVVLVVVKEQMELLELDKTIQDQPNKVFQVDTRLISQPQFLEVVVVPVELELGLDLQVILLVLMVDLVRLHSVVIQVFHHLMELQDLQPVDGLLVVEQVEEEHPQHHKEV